jgi:hypothetical protein
MGELLTNLYVGLCRLRRGERLSAARFIQGLAVDRLIALSPSIAEPALALADPFAPERRYEQRFPGIAEALPRFMQGYERSAESARALLAYVEQHFPVNAAIKQRILDLCAPPSPGDVP